MTQEDSAPGNSGKCQRFILWTSRKRNKRWTHGRRWTATVRHIGATLPMYIIKKKIVCLMWMWRKCPYYPLLICSTSPILNNVRGNTKNVLGCTSTMGDAYDLRTDKVMQICQRLKGNNDSVPSWSLGIIYQHICNSLWSNIASSSMETSRKGQVTLDKKKIFYTAWLTGCKRGFYSHRMINS